MFWATDMKTLSSLCTRWRASIWVAAKMVMTAVKASIRIEIFFSGRIPLIHSLKSLFRVANRTIPAMNCTMNKGSGK